jgi:hypothetical protein
MHRLSEYAAAHLHLCAHVAHESYEFLTRFTVLMYELCVPALFTSRSSSCRPVSQR